MAIKKVQTYYKMKDGNVYATDVDDTLIMWHLPEDLKNFKGKTVKTTCHGIEEEGIVNEPAVKHLKKMKARGYAVIVWSAGGSDWAEAVVEALEIGEYVDLVMPKIDEHLDDVAEPGDKIGRWQYIDPQGNVFRKNSEGKIIQLKPAEPFAGEDRK